MFATSETGRIRRRRVERFATRNRLRGNRRCPGKDLVARRFLIAKESELGHSTEYTEEELMFLGRS